MKVALWILYRVVSLPLAAVLWLLPALLAAQVMVWAFPRLDRDSLIALMFFPIIVLYCAFFKWLAPEVDRLDRKIVSLLKAP